MTTWLLRAVARPRLRPVPMRRWSWVRRVAAGAVSVLLVLLAGSPAQALPPGPGPGGPGGPGKGNSDCLADAAGSLSALSSVALGASVTLSWSVRARCDVLVH